MKLMALTIAGVMAASAVTPTAALAHPGHGRGHGWHDDRWDRGDRGWDRRHWNRDRRHWDNRRWDRGGRYWNDRRGYRGARFRTVCRWQDGPYGDRRVCYRVRV